MTGRTITLTNDLLSDLLKRKRPDNAKLHAEDAITASVIRAGFITPPVVNDADGLLLEGHGRIDVLKRLHDAGDEPPPGIHLAGDGDWLVPTVHGARLEPADARAFVVAANRTVELGGWDEKRLAQVLLDLAADEAGLAGVGYDAEDLDRIVSGLMKQVDRQAVHPDDVPDLGAEDITVQPGDTYQLGPHKVVCGDCRDPEILATALAGRPAAALITDPPYGVDYQGKSSSHLKIAGDNAAGLSDLLSAAFTSINTVLEPGASIYVFHPAGPLSLTFGRAICDAGWNFRQSLVWNKGTAVLGRSDYQYAHEPIIYAAKQQLAGKGGTAWHGGRDQTSVMDIPRPRASKEHPTMKPVALLEVLLKNSTARGQLVLDPFLGSGSLLVAAERLGRRCVGVEIEPRYVQVAIRRWEVLTGERATLVKGN